LTETVDHRRATAERNVEAILDAAERLLGDHKAASIAAVAVEAGVSRPTVYAHFPTREALLEAVIERAASGATGTFLAADLERGPATEALERMLAAGWRELERHQAIARAAAEDLPAEARRRAHHDAMAPARTLIARGQREGDLRDDLPVEWIATAIFDLLHSAADEVRARRMTSDAALHALTETVRGAFAAR
jgi:TetR/AcrR family transcriptional regulator, mexCD-oprJ operon repressor